MPYFKPSFFLMCICLLCFVVARCEPNIDNDVDTAEEGGDLGIVNEDVQDFGTGSFSPAPEVETVCVFPKNPSKG